MSMKRQTTMLSIQTVLLSGLLLTAVASTPARAAPAAKASLVEAQAPGWPQWRGPRRDGVSPSTGLLQSWPEKGPPLLWTATGLGRGYASPIVVDGTIYITGDIGEDLVIVAFDLDGKERWRAKNGSRWKDVWKRKG